MTRTVNVLLAPPFATEALRGAHVVAIDVLRATTTIATALANGADGVVPVLGSDDALAVAGRLGRDRVLLCGERDSVLIPGFDLDNSPASYRNENVAGKTLVFTTTNGTRALRAASAAASVRAAAFVNRGAVADALAREEGPIVILCAGVQGGVALEDALGAGALVDALLVRGGFEVADAARASALLYRSVSGRLLEAVASADHAVELATKGFTHDLAECSQLDTLDVVPIMRNGMLVDHRRAPVTTTVDAADAATVVARRLERELAGLRERHGGEYTVRGGINGTLLVGALQAYVAIAFRERRGEETLREIGNALEEALRDEAPGARNLTESFLEATAEWPLAWRSALPSALGTRGGELLAAMTSPAGVRE